MSFFWKESSKEVRRTNDIKKMFKFASIKNNGGVNMLIKYYELDINSPECMDDYQNSLLHIAVATSNKSLITQLLKLGINLEHKNNFNELPIDIAIKNNDLDIIRLLEEKSNNMITQLEDEIKKLNQSNNELTKGLKRQREECETYINTNKKLIIDNNELRKTIDNLRESFKK